ncbi:SDR family NAD(P)-dependent oxidoreductase [Arthrobacter sp. H41]|uniref:SDR family NAD(P)-dependent oxidoreductase n=1 Tax=Arthrobacter sp. H41 TaxID=1312978 RepID=UPI001C1E1EA4
MDLNNRTILLTGAGSGIGRALALELAQYAPRLALVGRRQEPLEEVADLVREKGEQAVVIPADLTADGTPQLSSLRHRNTPPSPANWLDKTDWTSPSCLAHAADVAEGTLPQQQLPPSSSQSAQQRPRPKARQRRRRRRFPPHPRCRLPRRPPCRPRLKVLWPQPPRPSSCRSCRVSPGFVQRTRHRCRIRAAQPGSARQ